MLTSTSNLVPHPVLAYDSIDETLEIPILSLSRTDRAMWPVTGVWPAILLSGPCAVLDLPLCQLPVEGALFPRIRWILAPNAPLS